MIIGAGQGRPPNYFERNSTFQGRNYAVYNQGPTGGIVGFSYTVPSGKIAHVGNCQCSFLRQTAAAPAGLVEAFVAISGLSGGNSVPAYTAAIDNAIGIQHSQSGDQDAYIVAGDGVIGFFADPSTGGTHAITITASINQFDA